MVEISWRQSAVVTGVDSAPSSWFGHAEKLAAYPTFLGAGLEWAITRSSGVPAPWRGEPLNPLNAATELRGGGVFKVPTPNANCGVF